MTRKVYILFYPNHADKVASSLNSPTSVVWKKFRSFTLFWRAFQINISMYIQYNIYINMSYIDVIKDEVPKVRELFNNKLHKGLTRGLPHRSIPLDFMGFFAFGGLERDKQLKESIKQHMIISIQKRREFIKTLTQSNNTSGTYVIIFVVTKL